jgi:hypothetical protein
MRFRRFTVCFAFQLLPFVVWQRPDLSRSPSLRFVFENFPEVPAILAPAPFIAGKPGGLVLPNLALNPVTNLANDLLDQLIAQRR